MDDNTTIHLNKESLNTLFKGRPSKDTLNHEISIFRAGLALPEHLKNKNNYSTIACLLLFTLFSFTSQSIWVVITGIIVCFFTHYIVKAILANKHFYVVSSPKSAITIQPNEVYLPALLFEDKTARTLNRTDILNIHSDWNYTKGVRSQRAPYSRKRRPYFFNIIIETRFGKTHELSNWGVDSYDLFKALVEYNYPVAITKVNKNAEPIIDYIKIATCFIIVLIVANALLNLGWT